MMPLEDIVYAVNNFPKAFIVGLVLEPSPMTVVEMNRKIRKNYPYLKEFTFLGKLNLRQYCVRSLANILNVTSVHSGWDQGGAVLPYSPAYSLKDASMQKYAKFILTKAAELNIQPEDFLALTRNSHKKSNFALIKIMLYMRENKKISIDSLSRISKLGYPSTFNHLEKLEKSGLAKLTRFRSNKHDFAFQRIEGRQVKDIDFESVKPRNAHALRKIANAWSKTRKSFSYENIHELTGYSYGLNKYAVNALLRQGFVRRISSQKYAHATLTQKGRQVVEQIIMPLISGDIKHLEPTEAQLVKAMSLYEKKL